MIKKDVPFIEMLHHLQCGRKAKLPEWGGHWMRNGHEPSIDVRLRCGAKAQNAHILMYCDRNDWIVFEDEPNDYRGMDHD